MILTKKELRSFGKEYDRKQIAERALQIAEMCVEADSYKNAVACIGRMVSLSKAIDDDYWDQKFQHGAGLERYYLLSGMKLDHPDRDTTVV